MKFTALRPFIVLTAFAALTACSNETTVDSLKGRFTQAKTDLQSIVKKPPPGPNAEQIKAVLTPEVRAQLGNRPVIVTTLEEPPISAAAILSSDGNGAKIYTTLDNISLTLKNGLIAGTRGLGDDLMDADPTEVWATIQAGGGRARRVHRYLDGENQTVLRAFICEISGTAPVTETCYGEDTTFTNTYTLGPDGQIITSKQWIGPERGYIYVEDVG